VTIKSERHVVGEGERLYAQRRRRFWFIILGLCAIGLGGGFLSGFIAGFADARQMTAEPLYATVGAIGAVLLAIAAAFGSWRYFVHVDEVEVADNLWGSLIGFYAYAILFPLWWVLWKLEKAPEPQDWTILGIALAVSLLAYGIRKLQAR
jgi:uncharacterized membrane protein